MRPVTLSSVKVGDYFTLKPIEQPLDRQVYVRGDYERSSKKYSCSCYSDTCSERFIKGDKIVYVDFEF